MGILSNIFTAVKSSPVGKVLDFTTVAFNHPIETAKAVISGGNALQKLEEKHFSEPLTQQLAQTAKQTAIYAATTVAAGSSAVRGAVVSAAKAIIPTTTKGKIIAAATIPIAAKVVYNKPSTIVEAPAKVLNFQSNVADLITNPSLDNLTKTVKENPLISTAVGAGGILAIGGGTAGVISSVLSTKATKENTRAVIENTMTSSSPKTENVLIPETPKKQSYAADVVEVSNTPLSSTTPQLPQTKSISAVTTKKKSYKKKTKKQIQSINQRVNVSVGNRLLQINNNKRYLNRKLLNF